VNSRCGCGRSLIAKVIVHTPSSDFEVAAARTSRALSEFKIGAHAIRQSRFAVEIPTFTTKLS
jgi:hypothetical protein